MGKYKNKSNLSKLLISLSLVLLIILSTIGNVFAAVQYKIHIDEPSSEVPASKRSPIAGSGSLMADYATITGNPYTFCSDHGSPMTNKEKSPYYLGATMIADPQLKAAMDANDQNTFWTLINQHISLGGGTHYKPFYGTGTNTVALLNKKQIDNQYGFSSFEYGYLGVSTAYGTNTISAEEMENYKKDLEDTLNDIKNSMGNEKLKAWVDDYYKAFERADDNMSTNKALIDLIHISGVNNDVKFEILHKYMLVYYSIYDVKDDCTDNLNQSDILWFIKEIDDSSSPFISENLIYRALCGAESKDAVTDEKLILELVIDKNKTELLNKCYNYLYEYALDYYKANYSATHSEEVMIKEADRYANENKEVYLNQYVSSLLEKDSSYVDNLFASLKNTINSNKETFKLYTYEKVLKTLGTELPIDTFIGKIEAPTNSDIKLDGKDEFVNVLNELPKKDDYVWFDLGLQLIDYLTNTYTKDKGTNFADIYKKGLTGEDVGFYYNGDDVDKQNKAKEHQKQLEDAFTIIEAGSTTSIDRADLKNNPLSSITGKSSQNNSQYVMEQYIFSRLINIEEFYDQLRAFKDADGHTYSKRDTADYAYDSENFKYITEYFTLDFIKTYKSYLAMCAAKDRSMVYNGTLTDGTPSSVNVDQSTHNFDYTIPGFVEGPQTINISMDDLDIPDNEKPYAELKQDVTGVDAVQVILYTSEGNTIKLDNSNYGTDFYMEYVSGTPFRSVNGGPELPQPGSVYNIVVKYTGKTENAISVADVQFKYHYEYEYLVFEVYCPQDPSGPNQQKISANKDSVQRKKDIVIGNRVPLKDSLTVEKVIPEGEEYNPDDEFNFQLWVEADFVLNGFVPSASDWIIPISGTIKDGNGVTVGDGTHTVRSDYAIGDKTVEYEGITYVLVDKQTVKVGDKATTNLPISYSGRPKFLIIEADGAGQFYTEASNDSTSSVWAKYVPDNNGIAEKGSDGVYRITNHVKKTHGHIFIDKKTKTLPQDRDLYFNINISSTRYKGKSSATIKLTLTEDTDKYVAVNGTGISGIQRNYIDNEGYYHVEFLSNPVDEWVSGSSSYSTYTIEEVDQYNKKYPENREEYLKGKPDSIWRSYDKNPTYNKATVSPYTFEECKDKKISDCTIISNNSNYEKYFKEFEEQTNYNTIIENSVDTDLYYNLQLTKFHEDVNNNKEYVFKARIVTDDDDLPKAESEDLVVRANTEGSSVSFKGSISNPGNENYYMTLKEIGYKENDSVITANEWTKIVAESDIVVIESCGIEAKDKVIAKQSALENKGKWVITKNENGIITEAVRYLQRGAINSGLNDSKVEAHNSNEFFIGLRLVKESVGDAELTDDYFYFKVMHSAIESGFYSVNWAEKLFGDVKITDPTDTSKKVPAVVEIDGEKYVRVSKADGYKVDSSVVEWDVNVNQKATFPGVTITEVDQYGKEASYANLENDSIWKKYEWYNSSGNTLSLQPINGRDNVNEEYFKTNVMTIKNSIKNRAKLVISKKVTDETAWEENDKFYVTITDINKVIDLPENTDIYSLFPSERVIQLQGENAGKAIELTKENPTVESAYVVWTSDEENPALEIKEVDLFGEGWHADENAKYDEKSIWNKFHPVVDPNNNIDDIEEMYATRYITMHADETEKIDIGFENDTDKYEFVFKKEFPMGMDNSVEKFYFKFTDKDNKDITEKLFGGKSCYQNGYLVLEGDLLNSGVKANPLFEETAIVATEYDGNGVSYKQYCDMSAEERANYANKENSNAYWNTYFTEKEYKFVVNNKISVETFTVKNFKPTSLVVKKEIRGSGNDAVNKEFKVQVNISYDNKKTTVYLKNKETGLFEKKVGNFGFADSISVNKPYELKDAIAWDGEAPEWEVYELEDTLPARWHRLGFIINGTERLDLSYGRATLLSGDNKNEIIVVNQKEDEEDENKSIWIRKSIVDSEGYYTRMSIDSPVFYYNVYLKNYTDNKVSVEGNILSDAKELTISDVSNESDMVRRYAEDYTGYLRVATLVPAGEVSSNHIVINNIKCNSGSSVEYKIVETDKDGYSYEDRDLNGHNSDLWTKSAPGFIFTNPEYRNNGVEKGNAGSSGVVKFYNQVRNVRIKFDKHVLKDDVEVAIEDGEHFYFDITIISNKRGKIVDIDHYDIYKDGNEQNLTYERKEELLDLDETLTYQIVEEDKEGRNYIDYLRLQDKNKKSEIWDKFTPQKEGVTAGIVDENTDGDIVLSGVNISDNQLRYTYLSIVKKIAENYQFEVERPDAFYFKAKNQNNFDSEKMEDCTSKFANYTTEDGTKLIRVEYNEDNDDYEFISDIVEWNVKNDTRIELEEVDQFGKLATDENLDATSNWNKFELVSDKLVCYLNLYETMLEVQKILYSNSMSTSDYVQGDVTGDGIVDDSDIDLALSYVVESVELSNAQLSRADCNADNKVDIIDVIYISNLTRKNANIKATNAGKLHGHITVSKTASRWINNQNFYVKLLVNAHTMVDEKGNDIDIIDTYFKDAEVKTFDDGSKAIVLSKDKSSVTSSEITWLSNEKTPKFFMIEVDQFGDPWPYNDDLSALNANSLWHYYTPKAKGRVTASLAGRVDHDYNYTMTFENEYTPNRISINKYVSTTFLDDDEFFFRVTEEVNGNVENKTKELFDDRKIIKINGEDTLVFTKEDYDNKGIISKDILGNHEYTVTEYDRNGISYETYLGYSKEQKDRYEAKDDAYWGRLWVPLNKGVRKVSVNDKQKFPAVEFTNTDMTTNLVVKKDAKGDKETKFDVSVIIEATENTKAFVVKNAGAIYVYDINSKEASEIYGDKYIARFEISEKDSREINIGWLGEAPNWYVEEHGLTGAWYREGYITNGGDLNKDCKPTKVLYGENKNEIVVVNDKNLGGLQLTKHIVDVKTGKETTSKVDMTVYFDVYLSDYTGNKVLVDEVETDIVPVNEAQTARYKENYTGYLRIPVEIKAGAPAITKNITNIEFENGGTLKYKVVEADEDGYAYEDKTENSKLWKYTKPTKVVVKDGNVTLEDIKGIWTGSLNKENDKTDTITVDAYNAIRVVDLEVEKTVYDSDDNLSPIEEKESFKFIVEIGDYITKEVVVDFEHQRQPIKDVQVRLNEEIPYTITELDEHDKTYNERVEGESQLWDNFTPKPVESNGIFTGIIGKDEAGNVTLTGTNTRNNFTFLPIEKTIEDLNNLDNKPEKFYFKVLSEDKATDYTKYFTNGAETIEVIYNKDNNLYTYLSDIVSWDNLPDTVRVVEVEDGNYKDISDTAYTLSVYDKKEKAEEAYKAYKESKGSVKPSEHINVIENKAKLVISKTVDGKDTWNTGDVFFFTVKVEDNSVELKDGDNFVKKYFGSELTVGQNKVPVIKLESGKNVKTSSEIEWTSNKTNPKLTVIEVDADGKTRSEYFNQPKDQQSKTSIWTKYKPDDDGTKYVELIPDEVGKVKVDVESFDNKYTNPHYLTIDKDIVNGEFEGEFYFKVEEKENNNYKNVTSELFDASHIKDGYVVIKEADHKNKGVKSVEVEGVHTYRITEYYKSGDKYKKVDKDWDKYVAGSKGEWTVTLGKTNKDVRFVAKNYKTIDLSVIKTIVEEENPEEFKNTEFTITVSLEKSKNTKAIYIKDQDGNLKEFNNDEYKEIKITPSNGFNLNGITWEGEAPILYVKEINIPDDWKLTGFRVNDDEKTFKNESEAYVQLNAETNKVEVEIKNRHTEIKDVSINLLKTIVDGNNKPYTLPEASPDIYFDVYMKNYKEDTLSVNGKSVKIKPVKGDKDARYGDGYTGYVRVQTKVEANKSTSNELKITGIKIDSKEELDYYVVEVDENGYKFADVYDATNKKFTKESILWEYLNPALYQTSDGKTYGSETGEWKGKLSTKKTDASCKNIGAYNKVRDIEVEITKYVFDSEGKQDTEFAEGETFYFVLEVEGREPEKFELTYGEQETKSFKFTTKFNEELKYKLTEYDEKDRTYDTYKTAKEAAEKVSKEEAEKLSSTVWDKFTPIADASLERAKWGIEEGTINKDTFGKIKLQGQNKGTIPEYGQLALSKAVVEKNPSGEEKEFYFVVENLNGTNRVDDLFNIKGNEGKIVKVGEETEKEALAVAVKAGENAVKSRIVTWKKGESIPTYRVKEVDENGYTKSEYDNIKDNKPKSEIWEQYDAQYGDGEEVTLKAALSEEEVEAVGVKIEHQRNYKIDKYPFTITKKVSENNEYRDIIAGENFYFQVAKDGIEKANIVSADELKTLFPVLADVEDSIHKAKIGDKEYASIHLNKDIVEKIGDTLTSIAVDDTIEYYVIEVDADGYTQKEYNDMPKEEQSSSSVWTEYSVDKNGIFRVKDNNQREINIINNKTTITINVHKALVQGQNSKKGFDFVLYKKYDDGEIITASIDNLIQNETRTIDTITINNKEKAPKIALIEKGFTPKWVKINGKDYDAILVKNEEGELEPSAWVDLSTENVNEILFDVENDIVDGGRLSIEKTVNGSNSSSKEYGFYYNYYRVDKDGNRTPVFEDGDHLLTISAQSGIQNTEYEEWNIYNGEHLEFEIHKEIDIATGKDVSNNIKEVTINGKEYKVQYENDKVKMIASGRIESKDVGDVKVVIDNTEDWEPIEFHALKRFINKNFKTEDTIALLENEGPNAYLTFTETVNVGNNSEFRVVTNENGKIIHSIYTSDKISKEDVNGKDADGNEIIERYMGDDKVTFTAKVYYKDIVAYYRGGKNANIDWYDITFDKFVGKDTKIIYRKGSNPPTTTSAEISSNAKFFTTGVDLNPKVKDDTKGINAVGYFVNTYSDREFELTTLLAGKVWTEDIENKQQGQNLGYYDGKDANGKEIDTLLSGVKVRVVRRLYNKDGQEVACKDQRILANASDTKNVTITQDGSWSFENVFVPAFRVADKAILGYSEDANPYLDGCRVKYDIEFEYDGLKYQAYEYTDENNNFRIGNENKSYSADEFINMAATAGVNDYIYHLSHAKESKDSRDNLVKQIGGINSNNDNSNGVTVSGVTPITYKDGSYVSTGKVGNTDVEYITTYDATNKTWTSSPKLNTDGTDLMVKATTSGAGLQYVFNADEIELDNLTYGTVNELFDEGDTNIKVDKNNGYLTATKSNGGEKIRAQRICNYMTNINLCLVKTPQADLSLDKKAVGATIIINNHVQTYYKDYVTGKWVVELNDNQRNAIANYLDGYDYNVSNDAFGIYSSDYSFRNRIPKETELYKAYLKFYKAAYGLSDEDFATEEANEQLMKLNELQIYFTFATQVQNQSSGYDIVVNEIDDYSDSSLTFVDVKSGYLALDEENAKKYKAENTPGLWAAIADKNNLLKVENVLSSTISKELVTETWYLKPDAMKEVFKDSEDNSWMSIDNDYNYLNPTQNGDMTKAKIVTPTAKKLKAGEMWTFYTTYRVDSADKLEVANSLFNEGKSEKNLAEISAFTPYIANTEEPAIVLDADSAPGNYNSDSKYANIMEDDTHADEVMLGITENKRMISGIASIKGYGLNAITTNLVEVVDIPVVTDDGKILYDYNEYEYYCDTMKTDKDGKYNYGNESVGLIPANYIVRFVYGDTDETSIIQTVEENGEKVDKDMTTSVLTSTKINGMDYKTAKYDSNVGNTGYIDNEWMTLNPSERNENSNLARDNEARRLFLIQNNQLLNNINTSELNLANVKNNYERYNELYNLLYGKKDTKYFTYATHYNDSKEKLFSKLSYENNGSYAYDNIITSKGYSMFADTAKMNLKVDKVDAGFAEDAVYDVAYVNLVLEERPETKIYLDKQVKDVKLTLNTGKEFFHAIYNIEYKVFNDNPESGYSKVKDNLWVKVTLDESSIGTNNMQKLNTTYYDSDNKNANVTQGFEYINTDSQFLQGLKMKITYQISAFNLGDTDYYGTGLEEIMKDNGQLYSIEERAQNFNNAIEKLKSYEYKSNEERNHLTLANGNEKVYGYYLGHNYYEGTPGNGDKVVTTAVRQVVDYIDNDIQVVQDPSDADGVNNMNNWDLKANNTSELKGLFESNIFVDGAIQDETQRPYGDNHIAITKSYKSEGEGFNKELIPYSAAGGNLNESMATVDIVTGTTFSATDDGDVGMDNMIEILEIENTVARRDEATVYGNMDPKGLANINSTSDPVAVSISLERDEAFAETVTLSPPTGSIENDRATAVAVAIIVALSILAGAGTGLTLRFTNKKKKDDEK